MNFGAYQVTLTLDRVFDIVRDAGNDKEPSTLFSFQYGDKHEYGVTVPGEPEISDGMTITAILNEAGNWQTLIGWVNHRTGELVCKTRPIFGIFMALPFLVASLAVLTNHPFLGSFLLLFSLVLFCSSVWTTYRLTKVRAKLVTLIDQHQPK